MSRQVSRGSAGEYQADEQAGVVRLCWRVSKPSLALWQTDGVRPCRPRNGSWTQTEVWLWS